MKKKNNNFFGLIFLVFTIHIVGQVTTRVYFKNTLKTGNVTLFCEKTDVFQHMEPVELPIGIYEYPFCYKLPQNIPYTALIGEYGKESFITYFIKTRLNEEGQPEKELWTRFKVINDLDLNLDPSLRVGQQIHESINLYRFCCIKKNILLHASIPMSGFAVGEGIPISIKYINKNNYRIPKTLIKLIQEVHIRVEASVVPVKILKWTLKSKLFATDRNDAEDMTAVCFMDIPDDLIFISNDHICELIKVKYKLQVMALTPLWGRSNKLEFPIKIGTQKIQSFSDNSALNCSDAENLNREEARENQEIFF